MLCLQSKHNYRSQANGNNLYESCCKHNTQALKNTIMKTSMQHMSTLQALAMAIYHKLSIQSEL